MHNSEKFSYWERKSFLDDIDILIIGAGIVGYSTALHLKESNPALKVVIVERGILPNGASSKNAGFACFGSATELYNDLQSIPEDEVWETVKLRWQGLQYLRETIGDEGLKLKNHGSWDLITVKEREIYENTKKQLPYFNQRLEEITGVKNVYSEDNQIGEKLNFSGIESSFFNRLEGQIDTASMNAEFYKKIVAKDIPVLFGVEVLDVNKNSVQTDMGEILARKIVLCTNGFSQRFIEKETIRPARAQVLITKPIENLSINGTFHYDCGYYYFRNIDNRILFGGGRNLNFEQEETTNIQNTEDIISHLKHLLKTVILPDTDFEIDHQWAGIMGVGESKKPIIQKLTPSLYCGVRLGGMGVAIGTLVGNELAQLILQDH